MRAVSAVLAVLMLVAIVVVGALVVYAWVMGYISFSTEGAGEAIKIPSIANDPEDIDLLVYVQNVGDETVQLEERGCLYVNGQLVSCTITGVVVSEGVATLGHGETAVLRHEGGAVLPDEKVTVKVTTVRGTSAEKSGYPAGAAYIPPALNHFTFDVIVSPQTSGRAFNVTVWAIDQYDNIFVGYSGTNTLTLSGGEINPSTTGNFVDGVWSGTVTVTGGATDASITTVAQSNSSWTGTSNPFEVVRIEPLVLWNRTYGGAGDQVAVAMIETSDGGFAFAGGRLLVKTDEFGNMEWNRTYEGSIESLVETSDGGYALAGTIGPTSAKDFWLLKTDEFGNVEWNRTYGGTENDYGESLVLTSDGGYAIAGYTMSFGAGDEDFWLVKTDALGNMEWNKTYGGTEYDFAHALVATSDGGYAIAGFGRSFIVSNKTNHAFWLVKTDALGNMEWNKTYGREDSGDYAAYFLLATSDEGYILAGDTNRYTLAYLNMWVCKVDEYGVEEWNQTFGEYSSNPHNPSYDAAHSVVETPDGGYLIAGRTITTDGRSAWLIKTDPDGIMQWNQTYFGVANVIVKTSDGCYAIAGYIRYPDPSSDTGYNSDFLLFKIDGYGRVP